MTESFGEIDDLLMGNVSEETQESSNEAVKARAAAVASKLAQIRKDESQASGFDDILAKIVPSLDSWLLDFVVFLINHEIPSLTILAFIALCSDEAGAECFKHFQGDLKDQKSLSTNLLQVPNPIQEKVSLWLSFIRLADQASKTTKLGEVASQEEFPSKMAQYLDILLQTFLKSQEIDNFSFSDLKKILNEYQDFFKGYEN